jgi:hypothetical protein
LASQLLRLAAASSASSEVVAEGGGGGGGAGGLEGGLDALIGQSLALCPSWRGFWMRYERLAGPARMQVTSGRGRCHARSGGVKRPFSDGGSQPAAAGSRRRCLEINEATIASDGDSPTVHGRNVLACRRIGERGAPPHGWCDVCQPRSRCARVCTQALELAIACHDAANVAVALRGGDAEGQPQEQQAAAIPAAARGAAEWGGAGGYAPRAEALAAQFDSFRRARLRCSLPACLAPVPGRL